MRYEGKLFYFTERLGNEVWVELPAPITKIEPSEDSNSCIIHTESGLFEGKELLDLSKTSIRPVRERRE